MHLIILDGKLVTTAIGKLNIDMNDFVTKLVEYIILLDSKDTVRRCCLLNNNMA